METQLSASNLDKVAAATFAANGSKPLLEIDQQQIRDQVSAMVLETVEETLTAHLDAEADRLCQAGRYEHTPDRKDTRAGSYPRRVLPAPGLTRAGSYPRRVLPA